MVNRTDALAWSIHGTNPENLVEEIVRYKIHQSTYWNKHCFGLTMETLVDEAMELDHTGGTNGGSRKPTPFLCLALKMLEIQPDKDIVVEFIKNEDHKYVRVLGAFYMRLTGTNTDVYQYLEPLYNDYRKIRQKLDNGKFTLTTVDGFIDELLTKNHCCDTALPRIQKRWVLEACGTLEPRRSALEDDFEKAEEDKEDGQPMDVYQPSTPETEEMDRDRKHELHQRERDRDRDQDYDRDYGSGRQRDRGHGSDRKRDRDPYRHHIRDGDRDRVRERNHEDREHCRRRCGGSASSWRRAEDDVPVEDLKKRKGMKDTKCNKNDPEIIAMNKLRASMGLKPLM